MMRNLKILSLAYASLLLAGCNESAKEKPLWEQTKITDIAPAPIRGPGDQFLKTMNFRVFVFETPARNLVKLDAVWQLLRGPGSAEGARGDFASAKPLKFNDYQAFVGNSFTAGFGENRMWNGIRDLLLAAKSRNISTISLLLADGQFNDIPAAGFDRESLFYFSGSGQMKGASIGPGTIALRVRAEKIPGSRGVCKISAEPVFSPRIGMRIGHLAPGERTKDFSFGPVGFEARISPGQFVFLGPQEYLDDGTTLGSLFFSIPGREPVVRTYLLACTSIND